MEGDKETRGKPHRQIYGLLKKTIAIADTANFKESKVHNDLPQSQVSSLFYFRILTSEFCFFKFAKS
ncbi:hypothetical protein CDG76_20275 [Nostoc sp. 'Peltigera membranacea cyanobiont' 210A]|nr:hypothetical protein CDG76_20275 [Nostoc sp. 'Peltigera membranacea cyanobiont' 210A]